MFFFDIMLTAFTFLIALIGLALVALGIYIIKKSSQKSQQPSLVEPFAIRFMGGVVIISGLEMLVNNAYLLFTGKLMGTHHLAGASAFLLFFMIMGIATTLGRPFLVPPLIPKTINQRLFLGGLFIFVGILMFFKLSETYWQLPDAIEDIIFWLLFGLIMWAGLKSSQIRKQLN